MDATVVFLEDVRAREILEQCGIGIDRPQTAQTANRRRAERTFSSGLTPNVIVMAILSAAVIAVAQILLISSGKLGLTPTVVVDVLALGAMLLAWRTELSRRFIVTPETLAMDHLGRRIVIRWSDVKVFAQPVNFSNLLRRASISDGERQISIHGLLLPEFELIVRLAATAIKHRAPMMDNTYQLRSM